MAAPTPAPARRRFGIKQIALGCGGLLLACVVLGAIVQALGGTDAPDVVVQTSPAPADTGAAAEPSPAQEAAASPPAPAAEPSPSPEEAEEAPPSPAAVAAIGDDVQVGDVRWKVLSAENLGATIESDNEFIDDATTGGAFVVVEVEVENLASEQATMSPLELVDDQGRTFSESTNTEALVLLEAESCLLQPLNPNVPQTCSLLFEVPAEVSGLALKVGDLSLLGSEEAQINLDL